MLNVGIHENVVLDKAARNDRGTLVISYKQVNKVDPLAALKASTARTSLEAQEQRFLIYPISLTDYNGNVDTKDNLLNKIAELKDFLFNILIQYMTADKIQFDPLAGCGVTAENIESKLRTQEVIDKAYSNLCDQFIKQITPFLGESGKKFRVLFVRKSKVSNFPALRRRFLDAQPFMEPMEIPIEQSKLKFSDYEIKNKLDSNEPAVPADTHDESEVNDAAELLG